MSDNEVETKYEIDSDYEQNDLYNSNETDHLGTIFWLKNETLKLISLYQNYEDMFSNFGERKKAWCIISSDLEKLGINKDRKQCATKWNNLLRTYKQVKKTGRRQSKFEYFEQMDDILGDNFVNEENEELPSCSSSTKRKKRTEKDILPTPSTSEYSSETPYKITKTIEAQQQQQQQQFEELPNPRLSTMESPITKPYTDDVDHFSTYISKLLSTLPEQARGELEVKFLSLIYEKKREISRTSNRV